jgi:hypothetical protein
VPTPNPLAPTRQLSGLSCPATTTCFVVGTHVGASGIGVSLAERWNGTSWSRLSMPNPPGAQVTQPQVISCTSSSSCVAVGLYWDDSGVSHAFAARWNGTAWSLLPLAEPLGSQGSQLFSVSCVSTSNCVAVGDYIDSTGVQVALAEQWDGTSWTELPTPTPAGAQFTILSGVACTSSTMCIATGGTDQGALAERWDGTGWSIQSAASPGPLAGLFSVTCTSPSACLAVGTTNTQAPGPMLAEQWDGTNWTVVSTATPAGSQGSALYSVSCSSASACTAVGSSFDSSGNPSTVAERWDGSAFSLQSTPSAAGGGVLGGVACPATSACVAVGYGLDLSGAFVTLGEGWDGSQWSVQTTINPRGTHGAQLAGVSCKSSFCVAVGGTTDFQGNPVATLAQISDGPAWRILPTPNPAGSAASALNGVSCTSPSACVAVGGAFDSFGNPVGTLTERWDGTSWSIQRTSTSDSAPAVLNAVSCTSPSACTAVGGSGAGEVMAERWDGTRWIIQPVPAPAGAQISFLTGVSCTSATACTAVGGAFDSSFNALGTVTDHWNGTTWSTQPSPTSQSSGYTLNAVSCTSASACTAAGNSDEGMLAERWDGTAWSTQATVTLSGTEGNGDFLGGVACSSPSACTAVGLAFTPAGPATVAERWEGAGWTVQVTPTLPAAYDIGLQAVSCPTQTVCTAVGGYRNDGPSVTLAEQWNGDGPSAALTDDSPAAMSRLRFGAQRLATRSMALDRLPGRRDELKGAAG